MGRGTPVGAHSRAPLQCQREAILYSQGASMKPIFLAFAIAAALAVPPAGPQPAETRLVLLHTSDYHSHALPHYAEGEFERGGLARVLRFLRDEQAANPNTVVLSGGD